MWSASLPSPLITFKTADPAGSSSSSTASSTTVSTTRGLQRSSSSTSSSRRSSTAGGIAKSSSSRGASGNGGVSSSSSSSTAGSQGFLGEVTAARFFYMDELVVLATGNKLLMYRCGRGLSILVVPLCIVAWLRAPISALIKPSPQQQAATQLCEGMLPLCMWSTRPVSK